LHKKNGLSAVSIVKTLNKKRKDRLLHNDLCLSGRMYAYYAEGREFEARTAKNTSNYIHNITPVSHKGKKRPLPSTCYYPYTHTPFASLSSNFPYSLSVSDTLDLAFLYIM
jgi:hypothetical protein